MVADMNRPARARRSIIARCLRWAGLGLAWLVILALTAWAASALSVDLPVAGLRLPVAIAYLIAILAALIFVRGQGRKALACLVGFGAVLAWWLTIAPSNDRAWQGDVARTPWAEIDGDRVTIHDVRNFDYRTETDYTPRWEDRSYDVCADSAAPTSSSPIGARPGSPIRSSASSSARMIMSPSRSRPARRWARNIPPSRGSSGSMSSSISSPTSAT